MAKVNNSLNETSMAAQFTLFQISKSPLLPLLNKMSEYDSFQSYLGEASEIEIKDFIPELDFDSKVKSKD